MKVRMLAASGLLFVGTGLGVWNPGHLIHHPRVACESIATQIQVYEGMPADYDFQLCGAGMPAVSISCPQLPQPGRSVTCTVTPAKP